MKKLSLHNSPKFDPIKDNISDYSIQYSKFKTEYELRILHNTIKEQDKIISQLTEENKKLKDKNEILEIKIESLFGNRDY